MKDKNIYLIFLILFILITILVNPFGNFPLNDDWTHTWTIYNYLHSGNFIYPKWLSSNMYIPIIYGILLSKIFGFSFVILRFSNIFISFLSLILFFNILKELKVKKLLSFLLTLVLYFNPIFFNLSYTFMGDIPALFFLLLSMYLFILGFNRDSNKYLFFGSLLTILGFFIRQTNILLLPAACLYYILKNKYNIKNIFILFILPFIFLLLIYLFLYVNNLLPGEVGSRFLQNNLSYFNHIISNFWYFILLLSFFTLPVSISLLFKNFKILKDYRFYISFIILSLFTFNYLFIDLGNIISVYGLGPTNSVMQGDINFNNLIIYKIINLILIFTIPIFFILRKKVKLNFIYIFSFFYMLLILPILSFDRYLLMVLPVLLIYLSKVLKKYKYCKVTFSVIIILFAMYSIIGTYNYLEWNRVRWSLGESLVSKGILVENIEGGYEMNGWYLYNKDLGNKPTPTWAPWYVMDIAKGHQMKYIISFSNLGGYEVLDKKKVNTILSGIDYIYLNEVRPNSLKK